MTIKTLTDINRFDIDLDGYSVYEALPSHYDEQYPKLAAFLQAYYESLEQDDNPAKLINDLLTNRDVVSVQQEFLSFLSNELLLGKSYFEQFKDKRTALQFSNLLYRSKGTEYSIQQFFRIFYNIDVQVEYGRDYIFKVGTPVQDHLEFPTQGSYTGSTFQYTFSGAPVGVYVRQTGSDSDEWLQMRQDVDYIQNFYEKRVEFIHRDLDDNNNPTDGEGYVKNGLGIEQKTPFFINLAETAYLGTDDSDAQTRLKLITSLDRKDYSAIGPDATQKRLTNDKFYQLFAIMIQTPVSVNVWRDSYKTFVHPAGMYLEGRVQIVSVAKLGIRAETIIQVPEVEIVLPAKVGKGDGRVIVGTDLTELAPSPFDDYIMRTRINDMLRDELHNANYQTDRLLIGTQDDSDAQGWGRQYLTLHRADDINSRTLDDTYITLSNTINTLDENVYNKLTPASTGKLKAGRSTVVGVAEVTSTLTGSLVTNPSIVVGAASVSVARTFLTTETGLIILTEDSDGLLL